MTAGLFLQPEAGRVCAFIILRLSCSLEHVLQYNTWVAMAGLRYVI
jgi:hypothetical protein